MNHTGGIRPKKTRRWVLIADQLADRTIKIGGILVIAAVLGMMVFLIYEVLPLFKGGVIESHSVYSRNEKWKPINVLITDDYKTISASMTKDGNLSAWHAKTGTNLDSPNFDFRGKQVTAISRAVDGVNIAFGFSDGTVRFGRILYSILVSRVFSSG